MEAQDRITTGFLSRIPCYILLFIWLLLENSAGCMRGNFVNARYYTANVWTLPAFLTFRAQFDETKLYLA
jgi:hypothetical protein